MTFVGLIGHNVRTRAFRSTVTAIAVALGIMAVVTLSVLTFSLRQTAVAILQTGKADFSVAQKGMSDVLYSAIADADVARIRAQPGVDRVVGALISTVKLDTQHPFFLEVGIPPSDLPAFGVTLVDGRPFGPTAPDEIILGYRAAQEYEKQVGDTMTIDGTSYRVVGIYSTGISFGDAGAMFPLTSLQAEHRQPGIVTLAFVKVKPGFSVASVRRSVEHDSPQLATVRSESDYGRVDRNLVLITAANIGGSLLALFIGATGVMNTAMLSFYERIREFGVLRAVGWSRRRVVSLVVGEALVVSLAGAVGGVCLGFAAVRGLTHVPKLIGVFAPRYTAAIFWRALTFAGAMGFLGALYPALKSARLAPLAAIRHE